MGDEQRYTLAEAQAELRRRECRSGHSWTSLERRHMSRGVLGLAVYCSVCRWTADVRLDGPDPSWPKRDIT